MTGIKHEFSDNFSYDRFGRITGTYAISRFPDIPGKLARLKADPSNAGNFWIGTILNSGTFPLPWMIAAGDDTGWFALSSKNAADSEGDLGNFWQNASSGSCYLAYWIQS